MTLIKLNMRLIPMNLSSFDSPIDQLTHSLSLIQEQLKSLSRLIYW